MTVNPVSVALIGCGFFAENHMHAWVENPDVSIVAVCDMDRDKAAHFAEKFGVPQAFDDAKTMLEDLNPDIVDVATPVGAHRVLVELAVAPGRTVICQKPFSQNLEDAKAMVAAAARAKSNLLIHENFRWEKPVQIMKEIAESGRIGPLHFARFSFRHGYDIYALQPYLAREDQLTIMDMGPHLFDLARHFLGEAETLSCVTQRLNPKVKGEDAFTTLMSHAGSGVSVCEVSLFSTYDPEPFPQTFMLIEGRDGSLELGMDYQIRLHTKDGCETIEGEPAVPGWGAKPWHNVQDSVARFQAHAVEVARGQTTGQPTGADNLYTMRAVFAAYEAARTKSTLVLDAFDDLKG